MALLGQPVGIVAGIAFFVGLPQSGGAAEFSYNYLEVMLDSSRTENTAEAPLGGDAKGRLIGIGGSWEVFDSFYLKGVWSQENKNFMNEVAFTPVDLDSEQTVVAIGGGHHWEVGEQTSIYVETLAIADFDVKHRIPVVVPSRMGPPSVTTVMSHIEGNGLIAAVGMRHWIAEDLELEGQLSRTYTRADVLRTGGEISDLETTVRLGGYIYPADGWSLGTFLSYSKHTDVNFDNIRKIGLSLRYHFRCVSC